MRAVVPVGLEGEATSVGQAGVGWARGFLPLLCSRREGRLGRASGRCPPPRVWLRAPQGRQECTPCGSVTPLPREGRTGRSVAWAHRRLAARPWPRPQGPRGKQVRDGDTGGSSGGCATCSLALLAVPRTEQVARSPGNATRPVLRSVRDQSLRPRPPQPETKAGHFLLPQVPAAAHRRRLGKARGRATPRSQPAPPRQSPGQGPGGRPAFPFCPQHTLPPQNRPLFHHRKPGACVFLLPPGTDRGERNTIS